MKSLTPIRKVLIINIFGLGDVLFTFPLIDNLKKRSSECSIGFLCNRRTEALVRGNPTIDQVFVYERDEFKALFERSKREYFLAAKKLFCDIKAQQYDVVIDLSLMTLPGFLAWCAGIKRRVGFNYKGRSLFLNQRIKLESYEDEHVVDTYLSLLESLGIPIKTKKFNLHLSADDKHWAKEYVQARGFDKGPLIGIVPGGGASWGKDAKYKRWPLKNFAKLADKLIENCLAQIILFGDASEKDLCFSVAALMKHSAHISCEQTLYQFAALLPLCQCAVVNDGGPLHIAVAAGAKTVSFFGPVDEKVYGPYPPADHCVIKKDIACRPCYRGFRRASCEHISCLNQISVEDALRKVKDVL